ncbi:MULTISPECIES: hypothetical protein [Megasphaera]|uniref:Uncharacterized protein n=1 Tax=Megasphaera vaginalis (ex Srinivasan et al. 2021) TaxID=1111454 RepID=U7ULQ8_9FIRM|nr:MULTISPECIES: hypothetical protein [Megasphaera]ERT60211.1 hypothetical protein HMPREF1250_1033 [Megasphaera vaginalis (ex Srinivasan et al. 2021)]
MKQHELPRPEPWINSRHRPEEPKPSEPEISERAWREIISLQDEADTAIAGCLFLGGVLLTVIMVAYIMWTNHLIIH